MNYYSGAWYSKCTPNVCQLIQFPLIFTYSIQTHTSHYQSLFTVYSTLLTKAWPYSSLWRSYRMKHVCGLGRIVVITTLWVLIARLSSKMALATILLLLLEDTYTYTYIVFWKIIAHPSYMCFHNCRAKSIYFKRFWLHELNLCHAFSSKIVRVNITQAKGNIHVIEMSENKSCSESELYVFCLGQPELIMYTAHVECACMQCHELCAWCIRHPPIDIFSGIHENLIKVGVWD